MRGPYLLSLHMYNTFNAKHIYSFQIPVKEIYGMLALELYVCTSKDSTRMANIYTIRPSLKPIKFLRNRNQISFHFILSFLSLIIIFSSTHFPCNKSFIFFFIRPNLSLEWIRNWTLSILLHTHRSLARLKLKQAYKQFIFLQIFQLVLS